MHSIYVELAPQKYFLGEFRFLVFFVGCRRRRRLHFVFVPGKSIVRLVREHSNQWRREAGASRGLCPGWKRPGRGCAPVDEIGQNLR
jgi:hypothetical protein